MGIEGVEGDTHGIRRSRRRILHGELHVRRPAAGGEIVFDSAAGSRDDERASEL
jgi:hypothetical protein